MGLIDGMKKSLRQFLAEPTRIVSRVGLQEELGASGTKNYSGYIDQDFNNAFNGNKSVDIYEEMRRTDATVSATLSALKLPIMQAERQIVSPDPDDKKLNDITEFVRKNLFESLDLGFNFFLRNTLTYLDFGFFYAEKVYEVRNGQIKR